MDRVLDPWPFRGLVLRTPRLELRPDDDAGLLELNDAALAGSWLTQRVQSQGIGTEMRAAVLMLAFDEPGATVARSGAFEDNLASRAVTRKLGYAEHGSASVEGLDPCLPVLGL